MNPGEWFPLPGWAVRFRNHLLVAALALMASVAGVMNDFVYDDIPLIRDNARVHGLSHWREILASPYWPPPFVEQRYRPLTMLAAALEYATGAGQPTGVSSRQLCPVRRERGGGLHAGEETAPP